MRKRSYYTRLSISFPEPVYSNQSGECISRKMAEQRSAEDFTAFVILLILSGVPSKEPLPFITHMIMND